MRIGLVYGLWSDRTSLMTLYQNLLCLGANPIWLDFIRSKKSTVADYIMQVESRVKTEGITFLVGHSLGGLVCLKAAEEIPQIKRLALLAPAAPKDIAPIRNIFQVYGMLATLPRLACPWFRPSRRISKLTMFNSCAGRGIEWNYDDWIVYEPTRAFISVLRPGVPLKNVTCPTLIIQGSKDRITPPGNTKKCFVRHITNPGSRLQILEGQDHHTITQDQKTAALIAHYFGEGAE